MNRGGFRLAALVAAGLVLTGCGSEAIDAATAGNLQAEVRAIASTAAAGDPAGAVRLAQELKVDVENARAAGSVTEDRAVRIGVRLDAVIASLEAGQVPADAPTGAAGEEQTAPTDEATEGPIEEPTEEPTEAPAETVVPEQPTPVEPAPAQPAPAQPTPAQVPPAPTSDAPAPPSEEDGADPGSEDAGDEAEPDEQAQKAAERAAEQQRRAEERVREAAEKAAERAEEAAEKAEEAAKKGKPGE